MNSPSRPDRRRFLRSLGLGTLGLGSLNALGAARVLSALPWLAPTAGRTAIASTDYRALVCVFLYGGNDGHNTVVPLDTSGYAAYQTARPDLALAKSQLRPLTPANGSAALFGLHPDLAPFGELWDQGRLVPLFNAGPLAQPMTRADFQAGAPVPENLASHNHQQNLWQAGGTRPVTRYGWGGLLADLAAATGAKLPGMISLNGNPLFTLGQNAPALTLPPSGSLPLDGFKPTAASDARRAALSRLYAASQGHEISRHTARTLQDAVASRDLLTTIQSAADPAVTNLFSDAANPKDNSLAAQLLQVARLIEARSTLQSNRQIFFVSLGGFDTHGSQLHVQSSLFRTLSSALKSFHDATALLGVDHQVTSFTLSDFGRTLKPASSGSDHGWGSHHFILGGAVRDRTTYGRFPTLSLGGPDDPYGSGSLIPTTSVDQYAATLARWFGADAAQLATIFPNLSRFATADLGFMG